MKLVAEAIDPLLGTAFFFIAAGATESRIKFIMIECLLQPVGFHQRCMLFGAVQERIGNIFSFRIDPNL